MRKAPEKAPLHHPGQAVEWSWAPSWLFGPQPPTPLTHLAVAPKCRQEIKNRFSTELDLGFPNSMTVSSWPSPRTHSQQPAKQEPRRGPAIRPSPLTLRSGTQSARSLMDVQQLSPDVPMGHTAYLPLSSRNCGDRGFARPEVGRRPREECWRVIPQPSPRLPPSRCGGPARSPAARVTRAHGMNAHRSCLPHGKGVCFGPGALTHFQHDTQKSPPLSRPVCKRLAPGQP